MSEDIVVVELPTDRYGETALDRLRDHAENGTMEPAFRADLRTLLSLTPEPSAAVDLEGVKKRARDLLENACGWKDAAECGKWIEAVVEGELSPVSSMIGVSIALRAIETAIAAHTNRGEVERLREVERGDVVAYLRMLSAGARQHHADVCLHEDDDILDAIVTRMESHAFSADQIEKGVHAGFSAALSSPDTVKDVSATTPAAGEVL